MKQKILLLTVVFFSSLKMMSQSVVINGFNGTANTQVVGQSNYHASESIYLNGEIGNTAFTTSGSEINKISYNFTQVGTPSSISSFKIWLKEVTTSTFSGTSSYNTTGYTLVFNGTINPTATGWYDINLTTSFLRTSGKNLQVLVERLDNTLHTALPGNTNGFIAATANGNSSGQALNTTRRYNGTNSPSGQNLTISTFRPQITLAHVNNKDAAIRSLLNPIQSCYGNGQTISVSLFNAGGASIAAGDASVTLKIGGANSYTSTQSNSSIIAAGDSVYINFTGINLNNAGINYDTVSVVYAGDGVRSNDTLRTTTITASTISDFPVVEDFEGSFPLLPFKKIDNGTKQLWNYQTGSYVNAGQTSFLNPVGPGNHYYVMEGYAAPNSNGFVSKLFSNCVALPGTSISVPVRTAKATFLMSHDDFAGTVSSAQDSMFVSVSTDKGQTWSRVGGFARVDLAATIPTWKKDSVDLSAYVGQTIQIGFEGVSKYGGSFGLDSIMVTVFPLPLPVCSNPPTAFAGNDTTICAGNSYTLASGNPTFGGSATQATWSSSGTGSFIGGTDFTLATSYVPSSADSLAGSVTLSLITNNPVGGACLSDTSNLVLTINNGIGSSSSQTACDSYSWNGNTYTSSGDYTFLNTTSGGCSKIDTLHLTINTSTHNVTIQTACDSYVWNGQTYTASGTYTYSYSNGNACPSVDTLYLNITSSSHFVSAQTACSNYNWNGQTYTSSGTYTYSYTNGNGCPSVDTLYLTIVNVTPNPTEIITSCDSYSWNGQTYTASGTYTYSRLVGSGCYAIDTLQLTINYGTHNVTIDSACDSYVWATDGQTYTASGDYVYTYTNGTSCPSADTLHLTINHPTYNSTTEVACDSYVWAADGQTYTASGDYVYTYTNSTGCSSADTLHLTVNYGTHNVTTDVACDSYTWATDGQTYTASGDYVYTYTNGTSCPSADTLHLTINYGTHNVTIDSACDSYVWATDGQTYTTSGDYVYTYTNGTSCASADTLHLTINHPTYNSTTEVACDSYVWAADGQTYTASGDYIYTYTNSTGCSSADTLHLTVNFGTHNVTTDVACQSYVWAADGQTYTASGDYVYTYTNVDGCPSADTLHLTILSNTGDTSAIACTSFDWYGVTYTTSGDITHTLTNINGCDSVVTLHLIIAANTGDTTAHACVSFDWYGSTYTNSGDFTYTLTNSNGCDSIVTLHLTIGNPNTGDTTVVACGSFVWNGTEYTTSGDQVYTYTNVSGCDSVVTLHLTINPLPVVALTTGVDSMLVSQTTQLQNASILAGNETAVWSSADNTIATVDASGLVTGVALGTTYIVYTVTNQTTGCSDSYSYAVRVVDLPVPVTLISLSAQLMNENHSLVSWKSATEVNMHHYEVERSEDGIHFEKRGTQVATGNSNNVQNYSYTDLLNTSSLIVYYRLKMFNNDGSFAYSNVVSVRLKGNFNQPQITVYPNPFNTDIKLTYSSTINEKAELKLLTSDGKVIIRKKVDVLIGNNVFVLDQLGKVASGVYMIQLNTDSNKFIKQIIKK